MNWYIIAALAALLICIISFAFQFFNLIKAGAPRDLSEKSGDLSGAILYSYTKAMMPKHKESAYLHMPTYAAGLIYHMGTFLSLALFGCTSNIQVCRGGDSRNYIFVNCCFVNNNLFVRFWYLTEKDCEKGSQISFGT